MRCGGASGFGATHFFCACLPNGSRVRRRMNSASRRGRTMGRATILRFLCGDLLEYIRLGKKKSPRTKIHRFGAKPCWFSDMCRRALPHFATNGRKRGSSRDASGDKLPRNDQRCSRFFSEGCSAHSSVVGLTPSPPEWRSSAENESFITRFVNKY